jgi:two-component system sensor histidine kinase KdpD
MARGKLRIYLGAAPGVGKTYAMLNEGWRRHERGTDVVIGIYETHGRENTAAQVRDLEIVPRRKVEYRGTVLEEMDLDAVLARKPQVALVDELAHTNVPGSSNAKRWEDVEELLAAGIDVITTLNIQHLESVNDVVEKITGIKQQETIPDELVRQAEQVELVDMTPEALRRRMAHGNVYPAERVDASLANYFRLGNLAALREIALLWVADKVEENLQQYMEDHGIEASWETRERVVVALTGAPGGDVLIRRAARMARRAQGDLVGVHIRPTDGLAVRSPELLTRHRRLLEDVGGSYQEVAASDVGEALVNVAKAERATQLVLGESRQSRWAHLIHGSVVSRVLRAADAIDVHVIATAASEEVDAAPARNIRLRPPSISRRRQALAVGVAAVALPLVTLLLDVSRERLSLPSVLLIYLLVVVAVAAIGGFVPAMLAALGGFLLANYFFTDPLHTFTIAEDDNLIALIVFVIVGAVVGDLVTRVGRRSAQAAQARAEAETIAQLSGSLLSEHDPVPALMTGLRGAFGCASVSVLRRDGDGWRVESSSGTPVPKRPDDAQVSVPLDADTVLAVCGDGLGETDVHTLRAFTGQLALAVDRRRLRAEAAAAEGLAEANELRTALLAAVSHDLRTPLASIKASVTSLLQDDVALTEGARGELLEAIDEETDRLDNLVGNLLDMSRLQTGVLELVWSDVGLDEVVPGALAGLADAKTRVLVDVPETLPRVRADVGLLERAVANVVANALRASPADRPVRIFAGQSQGRVELTIADEGPGIPRDQRDEVFRPFQRLGDNPQGDGVGLGLAVARGFVEAMDGELAIDDTPGGGASVVISLPVAA